MKTRGSFSIERAADASQRSAAESRSALQSIDASLQGGLEPLVNNVETLARNILSEPMEQLLARLEQGFRAGLHQELDGVVRPLEELRAEIRSVSPETALREIADRLHGAITGGASDSAAEFRQSLEDLGKTLPEILAGMNAANAEVRRSSAEAVAGFRTELDAQAEASRRANEEVLSAVRSVLDRMDAVSSSLGSTVTQLGAQSTAELQQMLSRLEAQTQSATERVLNAAAQAEAAARADRTAATKQDSAAFQELIASLSTLRDQTVQSEQKTVELLTKLRLESESLAQLLKAERTGVEHVLHGIRESAEALLEQHEETLRVVRESADVTDKLSGAVAGLKEAAMAEQDLLQRSGEQVRQIREGREELESALRRISTAVADLMKTELADLRGQTDQTRAIMGELIQKVDETIVNTLVGAVQDLQETVQSLEKVMGAAAGHKLYWLSVNVTQKLGS